MVVMAVVSRAPHGWERWDRVSSHFEILTATFGYPAEIAAEISGYQPKRTTRNEGCPPNLSKSPQKVQKKQCYRDT